MFGPMERVDFHPDELPEGFHLKSREVLRFHFLTGSLKVSDEIPVIEIRAELGSCSDSEAPRSARVEFFVVQLEPDNSHGLAELYDEV